MPPLLPLSFLGRRVFPVVAVTAVVAACAVTAVGSISVARQRTAPLASATAPAVIADPLTVKFAENWIRAREIAITKREEAPSPQPVSRSITCMLDGVPARILEFPTTSDATTWKACPSANRGHATVELGTVVIAFEDDSGHATDLAKRMTP
jgi:hypothetical protein